MNDFIYRWAEAFITSVFNWCHAFIPFSKKKSTGVQRRTGKKRVADKGLILNSFSKHVATVVDCNTVFKLSSEGFPPKSSKSFPWEPAKFLSPARADRSDAAAATPRLRIARLAPLLCPALRRPRRANEATALAITKTLSSHHSRILPPLLSLAHGPIARPLTPKVCIGIYFVPRRRSKTKLARPTKTLKIFLKVDAKRARRVEA